MLALLSGRFAFGLVPVRWAAVGVGAGGTGDGTGVMPNIPPTDDAGGVTLPAAFPLPWNAIATNVSITVQGLLSKLPRTVGFGLNGL